MRRALPSALPRLALTLALVALLPGCSSTPPLPADGFVPVPGGRIAFRVIGQGLATPVLMIHGGPGSTSCSFVNTLDGVAATRPVVMYDQLGSGNSDRMTDLARDAALPRFVAEVVALRERLGLKQVHLVGQSWGATVALEYLLTAHPEGVRSVALVGPLVSTPVWIDDARQLVQQLPAESRQAIEAAVASGRFDTPAFQAANQVFSQHFGMRTPMTRERAQQLLPACLATPQRFNQTLYEHMWGPAEFLSTGTLRTHDRFEQLQALRLPVLFLVGEHDEARPETMRRFQARVPGSALAVIPAAGHAVHIDQPEAFNAALLRFLATVEATR